MLQTQNMMRPKDELWIDHSMIDPTKDWKWHYHGKRSNYTDTNNQTRKEEAENDHYSRSHKQNFHWIYDSSGQIREQFAEAEHSNLQQ